MIDVLIAEDSKVVREYLKYLLESDPAIRVIGAVEDGVQAVEFVQKRKPDVITMDIHMPRMDGFTATRRIMETNPVPIVIISANWDPEQIDKTFLAIEAGAVAILEKPRGIGHPSGETAVREIIQTVKLMSEVKVVRRWSRDQKSGGRAAADSDVRLTTHPVKTLAVAVGASTGGPSALQTILTGLPKDFPVPLLIVQHIANGFIDGLASWLGQSTGFAVHIAQDRESLRPGHAYLAPDEFQMGVGYKHQILLSTDQPEYGTRPSVSYLFRSVTQIFGEQVIGVILTGMGRDGSLELGHMQASGATTIAQDEESAIVHGMAGEAIRLNAATCVRPLDQIATTLEDLVNNNARYDI